MATKVRFPSSTGEMLAGLVDEPQGTVRGWGVFSHGFTLGKDSPAAARICKQLAAEGIGMLRFDAIGLGDSEGDWGSGSFTHKVDDIVEAWDFMTGRGTRPQLLVGHSFGGSAVLAAAHRTSAVAVATVGAPFDPANVDKQYDAIIDRVMQDGEAEWLVGGKALTVRRHFVEVVRAYDLQRDIASLARPLLVMHSPTDETVGIRNAGQIFRSAHHPRSYVDLEGTDHLMTAKGQAARAGRIISAWADQYLV
ncbi:alpha/beta hydrolase family protein [Nocardioides jiangxiensis]|uniref:Alpha/beta fold hydrolase n=1 Tax=Nocardioides jiangxiensis TaxID=3064524 RepID=A0ABT9B426_9ACTN|nr:alpha/beta fold hydrolase [Nocardioides sp. WY-20]MDO7869591.1 alpha/beta fold hydrolase [Nocardioides sp. WY-20]